MYLRPADAFVPDHLLHKLTVQPITAIPPVPERLQPQFSFSIVYRKRVAADASCS